MNPDLERRLRQYGATVDAAADAADSRRRTTGAATTSTSVADLDNVVAIGNRPHRFYRALAVAAAAVAVVAGGVVFAISRDSPSTGVADRPVTPTPAAATESPDPTAPPVTTVTTAQPATTAAVPVPATAPAPTTPPVCPSYTVHNDYHLEICDSGLAVRIVQERLRATVDSSLNVDGYFGPGTRNAVRSFQQQHGLTVDGQVGPDTWAILVPDAPGSDVDNNGIVDPNEISAG